MNEVKKIEVDIIKVAEQMGLNTERMLAYVFRGQQQQMNGSFMQEVAALEPLEQSGGTSLQQPAS